MAKIPIKFKRVAAAFDEAVRWQPPCESSSGSEHWPDSGASLSGLVNSFIEKGDAYDDDPDLDMDMDIDIDDDDLDDKEDCETENEDLKERKERLRGVLLECRNDSNKKGAKQKIMKEIEDALLKLQGSSCHNNNNNNNNNHGLDSSSSSISSSRLKRNIMSHLRHAGLDAGVCKSRWEKRGGIPGGKYEYVDVNLGKTRYIVEVNLGGELDVVRATAHYKELLDMIPKIMIIEKAESLKQIIRLMSGAMKESLKQADMFVAPWRRNGYLRARYFSPYKRTTSPHSASSAAATQGRLTTTKGSMLGFQAMPTLSYNCRDNHAFVVSSRPTGARVSLLSAALQGM
ncbi:hypothetical protein vseg_011225 [Gypsophila vaccaria]